LITVPSDVLREIERVTEIVLKSTIDVELVDFTGGDHMVAAAARVSTNGTDAAEMAQCPSGEIDGLINYLVKHRHGTPFEHNMFCFFVHAPIFVWREWHRHRIGFSYNEESGRYKQLEPVFYIPPRDRPMMKPDEKWRPGRPKFVRLESDSVYYEFCGIKSAEYKAQYASYEWSLRRGFDPGLARIDLGVGIYSGCWVTCNARSLMAFLSLRTHEPTAERVSYPLWEIDNAARQVEAVFAEKMPLTHRAFCENGRTGP
jgi:thymidylate synthase (FAD)